MFVNTKGVVIRLTKYSESDRILTLFTKENGKIQAIAKGARKTKSNLIGSTDIFCYSDFLLYKGKKLHTVNQADIIDSFYPLREDIYKLSYATYILELIEYSVADGEPNDLLFELLIKTLQVLSDIAEDYNKLLLAFQLKYISFIGYRPQLSLCVECGSELTRSIKFNIIQGGTICEKCLSNNQYEVNITHKTVNYMKMLMYSKLEELDNIDIPKNEEMKIEEMLIKYITSHIDRKYFKSLQFLKTLQV